MKWLILFIGFSIFSTSHVEKVRNQFPYINSLEECDTNFQLLQNENTPTARAYSAAMIIMKSKFVKSPLKKYQYFKKGKKALDQLIDENPNNIEFRYIRYGFQKNIPNFLGYNDKLEEDLSILKTNMSTSEIAVSFKKKMMENLLAIESNTTKQHKILTQLKQTL